MRKAAVSMVTSPSTTEIGISEMKSSLAAVRKPSSGEERRAKDRQNAAEETSSELHGFPLCEERSCCHAEKNGRKGHVHGIAAEYGEAAELEEDRLQKQADEKEIDDAKN